MRGTDPRAKCSDRDFIRFIETIGPAAYASKSKTNISAVYRRRNNMERKIGRQITPPDNGRGNITRRNIEHAARLHYDCLNGIVLVGSDAHIWPGPQTTAMRGFVKFCKELQPRIVSMNGDVLDFPQISRHPPIGHNHLPTVEDEIRAAQEQLTVIEDAAPSNSKKVWSLGNHDGRLETRLATVAPEFARLHGFSLKDYFPAWAACWSTFINQNTVIKHRYKGGAGATRANALNSGLSMITGHLHSANVRGLTDYNGTRWGMDTGCLADPTAQAFVDYTEDGALDWRAAFGVLTFHKGVLLQPELALVFSKNTIQFRGKLIQV